MTGVLWILVAETLFAIMRLATRANATALPWAALAATRFLGGAAIVYGVAQLTRGSLRIRNATGIVARVLTITGLDGFGVAGNVHRYGAVYRRRRVQEAVRDGAVLPAGGIGDDRFLDRLAAGLVVR